MRHKMNLVTLGGGGFIGACVYRALSQRENKGVFISRSFSDGFMWGNSDIRRIQCSADDFDKYRSFTTADEIDLLYMANKPSIVSFEHSKTSKWTEGIEEIIKTLDQIANEQRTKIRSVGLISSAGTVYGSSNNKKDAYSDLKPKSVYGLYHCLAESTLKYWCNKMEVDFKIMRVTNPYGKVQIKAQRKGLIVSLLETLKTGNCVELRGNGKQIRDYIYADDLGDAIIDIMLSEGSQVKNLSSGNTASGIDIVDKIKKITGKKPIYKLSKKEFDYEVKTNIVEPTLTKTVAYRGGFKNIDNGIKEVYMAMEMNDKISD